MAEDRERDRAHTPRDAGREQKSSTESDAPSQSSASDWDRAKPGDIAPSDQADGGGNRDAEPPPGKSRTER